MFWLYWIVIGIVAGWLAKKVIPGEGPGGILGDLVIGIVGSVIGGFLFSRTGLESSGIIWTIFTAFFGAVLLLWLARTLTRRTA